MSKRKGLSALAAVIVFTLCAHVVGTKPALGAEHTPSPKDWLSWPVQCDLGQDCYINRYVDHDMSQGVRDFRCRQLTGDRHTGTDIGITDLHAMRQGVDVTAAAAGIVIARRDGMQDSFIRPEQRKDISKVACGNNVALQHSNGFITRYCHLGKGSVRHNMGDRVAAGEKIGVIGLSGDTNFPHVHFTVQKGSTVFDPFTAQPQGTQHQGTMCHTQTHTTDMWAPDVPYVSVGRIKGLVYPGPERSRPDLLNTAQHHPSVPPTTTRLNAFMAFYGVQQGTSITRSIQLPNGKVLRLKPIIYDRTLPRTFLSLAYGKKSKVSLPTGPYTVTFKVSDPHQPTEDRITLTTFVEPAP